MCVVEWAEKGLSVLPGEHLVVHIGYVSDSERSLEMKASGKRYRELLVQLAKTIEQVKG